MKTLHNLMIEIAPLSVSRVFLFKEQTYHGRCLVAYNGHVDDLCELSDEERAIFEEGFQIVKRTEQDAWEDAVAEAKDKPRTSSTSTLFTRTLHRFRRLWPPCTIPCWQQTRNCSPFMT